MRNCKHKMMQAHLLLATVVVYGGAFASSQQLGYLAVSGNLPALEVMITARPSNGEAAQVVYSPDLVAIAGVSLSYKAFTIGAAKNLSKRSDYAALKFGYYNTSYGGDVSIARVKGLGIEDYRGSVDTSQVQGLEKGKVSLAASSVNLYFVPWQRGLELANVFDSTRVIRGRGIGLLTILSMDSASLSSQAGLIPELMQDDFGSDASILSGQFSALNLQLALAKSLEWRRLYFSSIFALGYGGQQMRYRLLDGRKNGYGEATKFSMKLGFGYSGEDYFTGFEYTWESPEYILESVSVKTARSDLMITFGRRF